MSRLFEPHQGLRNQHLKKFHNTTDNTDSITIMDDTHMEKDTPKTSPNAGLRNQISSQARKSLNDEKRNSPTFGIETYPNAEKNLSSISEQIARQNVEWRTDTNAKGVLMLLKKAVTL